MNTNCRAVLVGGLAWLALATPALGGVEPSPFISLRLYLLRVATGSVECEVLATGLGNVRKLDTSTAMTCSVEPPQGSARIDGLALCENLGGNVPPGLQPASIELSYEDAALVDLDLVTKNGSALVSLSAVPPGEVLDLLRQAGTCPNTTGFSVTDFVPCEMTVVVKTTKVLTDGTSMEASRAYACRLESCHTLAYDKAAGDIEPREYACDPPLGYFDPDP